MWSGGMYEVYISYSPKWIIQHVCCIISYDSFETSARIEMKALWVWIKSVQMWAGGRVGVHLLTHWLFVRTEHRDGWSSQSEQGGQSDPITSISSINRPMIRFHLTAGTKALGVCSGMTITDSTRLCVFTGECFILPGSLNYSPGFWKSELCRNFPSEDQNWNVRVDKHKK